MKFFILRNVINFKVAIDLNFIDSTCHIESDIINTNLLIGLHISYISIYGAWSHKHDNP
jgi:hypothetical protein